MWIRRTPLEIFELEERQLRWRNNPLIPLLIATAMGGLDAAMHWAGFRGNLVPWGAPIPFREAIWRWPVLFLIVFPIAYIYRLSREPTPPRGGTVICTQCFEPAGKDAPTQCACGGQREPIYYWRWQRDDLKRV